MNTGSKLDLENQRGVPDDVITHRNAWRKALEMAVAAAATEAPEAPDTDDKAYWVHELNAFDRTFDRLAALVDIADNSDDALDPPAEIPSSS